MPIGICKLCLQTRVLQDSHLLPKALYRMSRWEGTPNPNPMRVSARGQVQTSRQIKDFLLCGNCEQRLCANGESYTMSQVNRKEGFALLRTLESSSNKRSAAGFTFYYETSALGIERGKLAYFALSVFWRASVHLWNRQERKAPMISLGKYEEPIREYLLGTKPFPSDVAVLLFVCTDYFSQNMFYEPSKGNDLDPTTWTFQVRGLNFFLSCRDGMPEQLTDACLVNGSRQMIVARSCEDKIASAMIRLHAASAQSKSG